MSRATDSVEIMIDAKESKGATPVVELLVDGKTIGELPSPPYEFHWDSNQSSEGRHQITARAKANGQHLDVSMEVVAIPRSRYKGPYPPSTLVKAMSLDWSSHKRKADGADNFPVTWCEDDHQYTAWGDGYGFARTGPKYSLGFSRIEGGADSYYAQDIVGGNAGGTDLVGKSYGILCLNGILYMWYNPGSGADGYKEQRLYTSTNKARSWSRRSVNFPRSDNLVNLTFVQFGRNYGGARDNFVYIYANHIKDSSGLKVQKPGEIALIRVPKDKLEDRSAYQFFSGLDGKGAPQWASQANSRQPVFRDPNGVGWNTSVTFNAGIKRYILMTEHNTTFKGYLGVFESPEPWGPWSMIEYKQYGGIPNTAFFWNISNKWTSSDGSSFTMIFTGIGANDSWNTVNGVFTLY